MAKKLALIMGLLIIGPPLLAGERQIPLFLNYQGALTDEGGNPLQDGVTNIKFQIIDTAGTILYEESQDLEVVNGQVSAIIGNGTYNGGATGGIPASVFDPTDSRFLQVEVAGYKSYDPMEIVTAPYALWSDTALKMPAGAITSEMIGKGAVTKEHLNGELTDAIFPSGIPKSLLPSDTVYTGDFEGFRNTIQSTSGAGMVGVTNTFIYSGSQTVQGVLKDMDLSVRRRQEEIDWAKRDYDAKVTTETTARQTADTTLQTNIDAEATTRQTADTAHAGTAAGTHGVTGSIVGTTDEQTLTNKTLTSPTIDSPTITGTMSGGALDALPPIGSIIPFYDFNGKVTFNAALWKYCDGSVINDAISPLNGETLPDLSNRYLVGFGTEGGGDIGTAAWATAAIGKASHQIDIAHTHGALGVTASGGQSADHTHGAGTLKFKTAETNAGTLRDLYFYGSTGTIQPLYDAALRSVGSGLSIEPFEIATESQFWTKDGTGVTGEVSVGHTHDINHTHASALSSTQDIQPRSIRVRYIMRIK